MNILERAAATHGKPVAALVVESIESIGSVAGAAKFVGVSKPVLWDWLNANGYRVVTGRCAKVIPPAPAQDATQVSDVQYVPLED